MIYRGTPDLVYAAAVFGSRLCTDPDCPLSDDLHWHLIREHIIPLPPYVTEADLERTLSGWFDGDA